MRKAGEVVKYTPHDDGGEEIHFDRSSSPNSIHKIQDKPCKSDNGLVQSPVEDRGLDEDEEVILEVHE